jgi:hypothetical protein
VTVIGGLLIGFLSDLRATANARYEVEIKLTTIKAKHDLMVQQLAAQAKRIEKLENKSNGDKSASDDKMDKLIRLVNRIDTRQQVMDERQAAIQRDVKKNTADIGEVRKNLRRLERRGR